MASKYQKEKLRIQAAQMLDNMREKPGQEERLQQRAMNNDTVERMRQEDAARMAALRMAGSGRTTPSLPGANYTTSRALQNTGLQALARQAAQREQNLDYANSLMSQLPEGSYQSVNDAKPIEKKQTFGQTLLNMLISTPIRMGDFSQENTAQIRQMDEEQRAGRSRVLQEQYGMPESEADRIAANWAHYQQANAVVEQDAYKKRRQEWLDNEGEEKVDLMRQLLSGRDSGYTGVAQAFRSYDQDLRDKFYSLGLDENSDEFKLLRQYVGEIMDEERTQTMQGDIRSFVDQHPVIGGTIETLGGIGATLGAGPLAAGESLRALGYADKTAPINTNSPLYALQNYKNAAYGATGEEIREGIAERGAEKGLTAEEIEKKQNRATFAYNVATSTAESAMLATIGKGAAMAAEGAGVSEAIAKIIPDLVTLPIFSTSAYAQTVQDAQERGLTRENAVLTGVFSGVAESFFEKVSLDSLYGKFAASSAGKVGLKKLVVNLLAQAGIEGSEEGFTEIANILADNIINKDYSEAMTRKRELMDQGYSDQDAERMVIQELASQIGESVLAGAISGGIMGAGATGAGQINYHNTAKAVKTNTQLTDAILETARNQMEEGTTARQIAEEKTSENITSSELSKVIESMTEVASQQQGEGGIENLLAKEFESLGESEEQAAQDAKRILEIASTEEENITDESEAALTEEMEQNENLAPVMGQYLRGETGGVINAVNAVNAEMKLQNQQREAQRQAEKEQRQIEKQIRRSSINNMAQVTTDDGKQGIAVRFESVEPGKTPTVRMGDGSVLSMDKFTANDRMQTELWQDAAKFEDTAAANAFLEDFNGNTLAELKAYNLASYELYAMGRVGALPFDQAMNDQDIKYYATSIDTAHLRTMYDLGVNAAKASNVEEEPARLDQKAEGLGTVTDNRSNASEDVSYKLAEVVAEKTGVNITLKDSIGKDTNGSFVASFGRIAIGSESGNEYGTLVHELSEFGRAYSPKKMQLVIDKTMQYVQSQEGVEALTVLLESYKKTYRKLESGKTIEQSADEFTFDYVAGLMMTEEGQKDFQKWLSKNATKSEKRSIAQTLADIFDKVVEMIRKILDTAHLNPATRQALRAEEKAAKEIRDLWFEVMDEASENLKSQAKSLTEMSEEELEKAGIEISGTGEMRFSMVTFAEPQALGEKSGREILREYLEKYSGLTKKDQQDIMDTLDWGYGIAREMSQKEGLDSFARWSNTRLEMDETGKPLLEVFLQDAKRPVRSVVVNNGDYPLNIDFSQVCKKRIALNSVLNKLVSDADLNLRMLTESDIAGINALIKQHQFEIACGLCFVDARRYRVGSWADSFVNGKFDEKTHEKTALGWNDLVNSMIKKGESAAYFDLASAHVDPLGEHIDELSDDMLDFSTIDEIIEPYVKKSGKQKGQIGQAIINGERHNPTEEVRMAYLLRTNPSVRRLLDPNDIIASEGLDALRAKYPPLHQLVKSHWGTSTPKLSHGFTAYGNDIIRSKSWRGRKNQFTRANAYAVGGVRVQSFSDYVANLFFDYMQMFADMSARQLPSHTYTKEAVYARLFGMTGQRINLSLIFKGPELTDEQSERFQKLNNKGGRQAVLDDPEFGPMARRAGLDENGEYIFEDESFDFEEAQRIQDDPRYKYCGTIGVGLSDAHIRKMLADDRIKMVIPYHASGVSQIIKNARNLGLYTDYTDVQNTTKNGKKLEHGDGFDWYGKLKSAINPKGKDAKAVAAEYVEYCKKKGYTPAFPQFVDDPNYYKLVIDFRSYDNDGKFMPQGPVTMTFPEEEEFKQLVLDSLKAQQETETRLETELTDEGDTLYTEVKDFLQETGTLDVKYSVNVTEDSEGHGLSKGQQMYFAESKARDAEGRLMLMYHGTPGPGFYVFKKDKSDDKRSFFFTSNEEVAKTYAGKALSDGGAVMPVYLNLVNPLEIDAGGSFWNHISYDNTDKFKIAPTRIGDFLFLTEEDAERFNEKYGIADLKKAYDLAIEEGEAEYNGETLDEYELADKYNAAVARAEKEYREYRFSHSKMTSIEEFFDNYEDYGWHDLASVVAQYDKNGPTVDELKENADEYEDAVMMVRELFDEEGFDISAFSAPLLPTRDKYYSGDVYGSTRRIASVAEAQGYDGVIIRNVYDAARGEGILGDVMIAFNSNQVKDINNLNPTENEDIRYSVAVTEDSEGRSLSSGQKTFFAKSQVRDELGRLKVMYHGTPRGGFNIFEFSDDGISFFFTDKLSAAGTYSGVPYAESHNTPMTLDQLNEALWTTGGSSDEDEYFTKNGEKYEYWEIMYGKMTLMHTFDSLQEAQNYFIDKRVEPLAYQGDGSPMNYEVYLNVANPLIVDAMGGEWNAIPRSDFAKHFENIEISENGDGTYYVNYEEVKDWRTPSKFHRGVTMTEAELKETFGYGIEESLQSHAAGKNLSGITMIVDLYLDENGHRLPSTTREYAKYAKDNGYDGVMFNNIIDSGFYDQPDIKSNVVVVFNPNQIKSIYNLNPTENPDIRYSMSVWDDEIDSELQKDLDEANSILRQGFESLGDLEIDKKTIDRVADSIKRDYKTTMSKKDIANRISRVFAYLQDTGSNSKNDLMRIMREVAEPIMEEMEPDPALAQTYKDLRDYFKGKRIKLSSEQAEEVRHIYGSSQAFRNAMWGNGIIIAKDGVPLDSLWNEICDQAGGHLDYGENTGNMPIALADFMNALKPGMMSYKDMGLENAPYDLALDIYRRYFEERAKIDGADATIKAEAQKIAAKQQEFLKKQVDKYKKSYQDAMKDLQKAKQMNIDRLAQEISEIADEEKAASLEGNMLNEALLKAERLRYEERLQDLRDQKNEKIALVKAKAEVARRRQIESRRLTEYKTILRKQIDELNAMLAHPTEAKHIPVDMVNAVINVLESVNIDTGAQTTRQKLDRLAALYEKYRNNESVMMDYDERTAGYIQRLKEIFNGRNYTQLYSNELWEVNDILRAIKTQIRNANKLLGIEKHKYAREASKDAIKEVEESKKAGGTLANLLDTYATAHLNSRRFFRKIFGYRNGAGMALWQQLDDGQQKMMNIQRTISGMFQDVVEGKENQKRVRDLISTKPEDLVDVGLTDENGLPVKVSKAMRLSLLMHVQSPSNMRHILRGGLTVPDMELFSKNIQEAYARGKTYQFVDTMALLEAAKNGDLARVERLLGEAEQKIKDLRKDLSPWELAYLKDAEEMFHDYTGELINETSIELKGYAIARVKDYFPIRTDASFVKQDFSGLVQDASLEGMGMLKERVVSSKPILLEDITNVIARQTKNVSMYAGMAVPLRNLNMVLNHTFIDENGKLRSLKQAIKNTWGANNEKYLQDLMQDVQGGRSQDNSPLGHFMDQLRGNYAGAVLTLNPSVAIKQSASYPTAAAIVGWKPLLRAIKDVGKGFVKGEGLAELEKRNPLLWYRGQGYASQEMADAKRSGLMSKLPKALKWVEFMDIGTVRTLEYAAKYYVDERGVYKEGTDSYWNEVSRVFTRIVEETQPNYTPLQQAGIIRNPNKFLKQIIMFKTQPLQNFSIVYDAVMDLNAQIRYAKEGKGADVDGAKKNLAKAISAYTVASMVFSAMTILAGLLLHKHFRYKDDEGEMSAEEIAKAFGQGMLDNFLGSFIFGGELYEALEAVLTGEYYYGIDASTLETINNIVKNTEYEWKYLQRFANDALSGSTESDFETDLFQTKKYGWKVLENVATFAGIPLGNVKKIYDSIELSIQDAVNGEPWGSTESPTADDISNQYERMMEALVAGDEKRYDELYDEQVEYGGKTEDTIDQQIKSRITSLLKSGEISGAEAVKMYETAGISAEDAENKVQSFYKDSIKEGFKDGSLSESEAMEGLVDNGMSESEAYFQVQQWESGSSSDYGAIYTSIDNALGSGTEANRQAMGDEIRGAIDHGKDGKTIAKQITSKYKSDYLNALANGRAADMKNILITAFMYCGFTRDEAVKKIEGWEK